jgi:threonylcarbamoyladenosine tRNA methylthiotransferase CDKAL1
MPSVYVKAYGCSANTADAEMTKGMLANSGYTIVGSPRQSDINVVLSCIVKTPTEQKITKQVRQMAATGKPLLVAGCMPKAMKGHVEAAAPGASMVGPDDLDRVVEAVERTLRGERVVYVDGTTSDRTCIPRVRANRLIHIAPICTGCLGDCSYCIVKYARGRLHSYPAKSIVEDVKTAVDDGCREVWVTAEDTAAYLDGDVRLPQLLDMITEVPGDFKVRVGMMTPNQAAPLLNDLVEAYASDKVYKFLHMPIQSGNDEVLRTMRRKYTVEKFKAVVSRFRESFPEMGVSTDIICGFPGETREQFQDSLELIRWLRPDVLNISRFWERPGTEAAGLPGRLHGRETKERSRVLTALWRMLAVDVGRRWLGWEGTVLLTERGKGSSKVGRNYVYKAVALETGVGLGETVRVMVTGVGVGFLEAVPV